MWDFCDKAVKSITMKVTGSISYREKIKIKGIIYDGESKAYTKELSKELVIGSCKL